MWGCVRGCGVSHLPSDSNTGWACIVWVCAWYDRLAKWYQTHNAIYMWGCVWGVYVGCVGEAGILLTLWQIHSLGLHCLSLWSQYMYDRLANWYQRHMLCVGVCVGGVFGGCVSYLPSDRCTAWACTVWVCEVKPWYDRLANWYQRHMFCGCGTLQKKREIRKYNIMKCKCSKM